MKTRADLIAWLDGLASTRRTRSNDIPPKDAIAAARGIADAYPEDVHLAAWRATHDTIVLSATGGMVQDATNMTQKRVREWADLVLFHDGWRLSTHAGEETDAGWHPTATNPAHTVVCIAAAFPRRQKTAKKAVTPA